jgi:hypothetical protein
MLRPLRHSTSLVAAICLTFFGQGLLRAADVPAERRLPPGVHAFVNIPDAVDMKERFLESNLGQLIQDESLNEFRAQFEEMWEEGSREMEEEIGLSADQMLKVVDGEVTFAVLQPPGRTLGLLLMLQFGDQKQTLETLLNQAQEEAEGEADVTRTVETIQDTDVTVYTHEGQEQGWNKLAYFLRDDYLVLSFGNGVDLLEDVLIRWSGEHDQTFAEDEVFAHIMRECRGDESGAPQLKWFFSPIDLFRAVAMLPQANQGGISPAMALGFLPALGLDKFKAIGGVSYISTEEFDTLGRTFLYVNQPTSGLVRFFEFPAVRQEPPAWVPASVSAYSSVNWDVSGAYEAVEALVDFFQPPGTLANLVEQLSKQGPRIHIKDDVVDSLSGRFQMLGDTRRDVEAASAQPGVFALGLRNADRMADVIARAADSSGGNLTARDFRGKTIYEMSIPNLQGGAPQTMGVTVDREQLFFATDVQLLEEFLRIEEAEEPLANAPDYRRISSHFPSQTSIISFARPAAQWGPVYEQLRSGQLDAMVEDVDFSTLPEFERLAGHFSVTGGYAVPAENGALLVNYSLRKD